METNVNLHTHSLSTPVSDAHGESHFAGRHPFRQLK